MVSKDQDGKWEGRKVLLIEKMRSTQMGKTENEKKKETMIVE